MNSSVKLPIPILALLASIVNVASVSAAELVGKLTAVSQDRRSIEVDETPYRITSAALQGAGPDMKGRLRLNQLEAGQIVSIKTSGDSIIVLELLHGYDDIPN